MQPNSKDPRLGSRSIFPPGNQTVHLSFFTLCPKMQKNVRNMQGVRSQRDTGSRPRGPFPARAEGQGEDHCPESQDGWVGSCWASFLPWGVGERLPSLGPSILICKLKVIKPTPSPHRFKLVQVTTAGHAGPTSSLLPQGSPSGVSNVRTGPLSQHLPRPCSETSRPALAVSPLVFTKHELHTRRQARLWEDIHNG